MTEPGTRRLLVGGYTDDPATQVGPHGLVPFLHERVTGRLRQDGPALELAAPSYLLQHPIHAVAYAVNETESAAVTSIAIDGPLRVTSNLDIPGQLPCHLCFSPDRAHLVIANYGDGTVVSIRLDADGIPKEIAGTYRSHGAGPHPRQEGPHAHHALVGPDGTMWIVDLGADVVRRLRIGPDGTFEEADPVVTLAAGTGPRQIRPHHDRPIAYVLGELTGQLITVAIAPGRVGTVVAQRPASLTEPDRENLPAHLLRHGDRLYVSHRGLNRITKFDIASVRPEPIAEIQTGAWPRHLAVDDQWLYIAEQLEDRITAHPLTASPGTAFLDNHNSLLHAAVRRPSCVLPLTGSRTHWTTSRRCE